MLVSSLLLLLGAAIRAVSFSGKKDLEKNNPFECGFLGYEERRSSFSVHFFMVRLIFLIFDIELILIFPFITRAYCGPELFLASTLRAFLVLLRAGLILEWEKSMLDWRR